MNIIYSRLFEMSILHDFYQDGKGKDFRLYPTQETASVLKKGRMLWRELSGGLVVLYRAEDDKTTPEVSLNLPVDLFFYLESKNPSQLFSITNLTKGPKKFSKGDLISFQNSTAAASTNAATPEKMAMDIWDGLRTKSFISRVQLDPMPAKALLQVKDANGVQISSGFDQSGNPLPLNLEVSPDSSGQFSFEINLKLQPEGNYSIILRNEANTTDLWKKEYFLAADAFANSPLGVVKIAYRAAPNHLYGAKEFYALDFKRRSTKWTYFIVSQNEKVDLASANISILDKGNPPGTPYAVYNFQQIGAAPNAEIKVNDADTVIFKSQVAIPFFENPKLNLELRRTPGNRVLFSHLPNPSRTSPVKVAPGEEISEIYVFI